MDPDAVWDGEWVGRKMGILDGVVIIEGEGQIWGEFGRPTVTNWDFAMRIFPNYFAQDLFSYNRCAQKFYYSFFIQNMPLVL